MEQEKMPNSGMEHLMMYVEPEKVSTSNDKVTSTPLSNQTHFFSKSRFFLRDGLVF